MISLKYIATLTPISFSAKCKGCLWKKLRLQEYSSQYFSSFKRQRRISLFDVTVIKIAVLSYLGQRNVEPAPFMDVAYNSMIEALVSESKKLMTETTTCYQKAGKENILIFVKLLCGKSIVVEIDAKTTSAELKQKIETVTNLSMTKARLLFGKYELVDSEKLSTRGVTSNSTIRIVLRLRGGGKHSRRGQEKKTGVAEAIDDEENPCKIQRDGYIPFFLKQYLMY